MDYQSFIKQFSTAAIDNDKVAIVEKVYGVKLPKAVKHYVSACGESPVTVEKGDVNLFEAFSFNTIIDAESPMVTDCIKKNMIALAYCYDSDFTVYMFDDDTWNLYDSAKDEYYCENNTLEDYVNEAFPAEDEDTEESEEDPDAALKRILQAPNVKQMDIFEAAKIGFADAQFQVSCRYLSGNGVEQNIELGLEWLRKAAEQNHAAAQFLLGQFYKGGEGGIEQNDEEAFNLFQKSAKNGNADAMLALGHCYAQGKGVEQNYQEAIENYKEARNRGCEAAKQALKDLMDSMEKRRKEIEENIKGKKIIDVADLLGLLNIYRQQGVDFLWSYNNYNMGHAVELLRMDGPSSFEKEVELLEEADVYSFFKKELSAEELNSYDFYLMKGRANLKMQFAIKKLK